MNMNDGAERTKKGFAVSALRMRLAEFCFGSDSADARFAFAIGVGFSILYGLFAWRLARGHYFDFYNLLFDLDPPSYVNVLAPTGGGLAHSGGIALAIKHPLASWLSLFSLPFRIFGLDRLTSVLVANVCVGGATTAVLFAFARAVGTPRLEAILVTLIFGLGAAQLFSSMVVESYIYAALSLAIVWYIAWQRMSGHRRLGLVAIAADVLVFGITITNVAQAAIAELFAQWSQLKFGHALRNTLVAGLAVVALCALAIASTWPQAVLYTLAHPVQALKEIYWQQTYGPRTGLEQVLLTFFGFSLVAPHFDKMMLPEGILMRDFRTLDPSIASIVGMLVWNAIFLAGAFVAFQLPRTRFMAGALASAIIFNVVLHMRVQFRGSLFLYTPHLWFAIAALTALGIAALHNAHHRFVWSLRTALLVVLLSIVPVNISRAIETSMLFDRQSEFLNVNPNAVPQTQNMVLHH